MAERVGFEPTLEFPLNTLSKRAPSATRPSLPRKSTQESTNFHQTLSSPENTLKISSEFFRHAITLCLHSMDESARPQLERLHQETIRKNSELPEKDRKIKEKGSGTADQVRIRIRIRKKCSGRLYWRGRGGNGGGRRSRNRRR